MDFKNILVAYFRLRQNERKRRQRDNARKLRSILKIYNQNMGLVCEAIHEIVNNIVPRERRLWAHCRSKAVWENFYENLNGRRWFEEFRMTRNQFNLICDELKNEIEPKANPVSDKNFVPVQVKVAIAIYKLKSCSEYHVIGNIFGLHKSTIHFIFYEVIEAITKILTPKYIKMPTSEEAQAISANFKRITNVSQIIGAIDGTHIPIKPPLEGVRDLLNRKGWASIILQAVVDDHFRFRDISCKCPGSMHDALVLKNSYLFQYHSLLFPKADYKINDTSIPFILIADPAYPLLPWIIKDFPGQNLESRKHLFNESLNRGRVKVEQAFGMLKTKWRMLSKKSDIDFKFMPKVVAACCTLHNIVINERDDNGAVEEQQPSNLESRVADTSEGAQIRNLLFEEYCRECF